MSVKIVGDNNNLVNVTVDNELQVATTQDATKAGFVALVCENGIQPDGTRVMRELEASEDYRLRVGLDTILFSDYPAGTTVNTSLFKQSNTTMTVGNSSGTYILNSGNSIAQSVNAILQTWRTFPIYKSFTTYVECVGYITSLPQANQVIEWGLGYATGQVEATDGIFFRLNGVQMQTVLVYNTQVVATENITITPTPNTTMNCIIEVTLRRIKFWINDTLVSVLDVPDSVVNTAYNMQLPLFARIYNEAGFNGGVQQLRLGAIMISTGDMNSNKNWDTILSGSGRNMIQYPSGHTLAGANTNHTNNFNPAAVTLSNTTASYTWPNIKFQFNAIDRTIGATTDYILLAYQVPINNGAYITGVDISVYVLGEAIATTPTIFEWSIGIGSSTVSLSTTESITNKSRRPYELDVTVFKVGDPIGTTFNISKRFHTPLFVGSQEYIHIIISVPQSTATGGQTFRGNCSIEGYNE